jgi:hypothetical protein
MNLFRKLCRMHVVQGFDALTCQESSHPAPLPLDGAGRIHELTLGRPIQVMEHDMTSVLPRGKADAL